MTRKPKAVAEAEALAEERYNELFGVDEQAATGGDDSQGQTAEAEASTTQESEWSETAEQEDSGKEIQRDTRDSELEAYKARYNTLMGKYNSEVPRLQGEIRQLRQQVQLLQESLNSSANSKKRDDSLVSDEEIEEYGEDFTNFIRRIVAESVREQQSKPAAATAAEPPGGSASDGASASAVTSVLDVEVPQWRQINVDPDFASWVDSYDPLLGTTRRQALLDAYQQGNGYRVAAFFQTFLRSARPPGKEAKKELRQISGPSEVGSGPPPSAPAKKIWSRAEISAFYQKVRRGVYRDNPKQQALIEQQIADALREGRIEGA